MHCRHLRHYTVRQLHPTDLEHLNLRIHLQARCEHLIECLYTLWFLYTLLNASYTCAEWWCSVSFIIAGYNRALCQEQDHGNHPLTM
jgi:hypothetical protein